MHLSKFTDYALRVCLYLGARQDRLVSISEIAQAHGLSHGNLMKVVKNLVDGGFLKTTRGRAGGVELARAAEEIHVGEIARYMEGDTSMVDCSSCILKGACGLTRALREAKLAFYAHLNQYSLADALHAHPKTLSLLLAAVPSEPLDEGRN